jgi:hypothetical protein
VGVSRAIDAASHDDEWFEKIPPVLEDDPSWARRTARMSLRDVKDRGTQAQYLWERLLRASERAVAAGFPVNRDSIRAHLLSKAITDDQIAQALASPGFVAALQARGLRMEPNAELTIRQRQVLAIYFDAAVTATHAQRLRLAGVSSSTWDGWLRNDPAFRLKVAEITDEVLERGRVISRQRLVELADAGNVKAIDRLLAMSNDFDWRQVENSNLEAVLGAVFEVLDEHQVDSRVMSALTAKLADVLGVKTAAGGMITPTVPDTIQIQER